MAAREAASSGGNGPFGQLGGGLWSLATAPFQVPVTIVEASTQKNVLYGASAGTLQGVGRTALHVVNGVGNVLGALIPPDPMELVARKLGTYQQGAY